MTREPSGKQGYLNGIHLPSAFFSKRNPTSQFFPCGLPNHALSSSRCPSVISVSTTSLYWLLPLLIRPQVPQKHPSFLKLPAPPDSPRTVETTRGGEWSPSPPAPGSSPIPSSALGLLRDSEQVTLLLELPTGTLSSRHPSLKPTHVSPPPGTHHLTLTQTLTLDAASAFPWSLAARSDPDCLSPRRRPRALKNIKQVLTLLCPQPCRAPNSLA